MRSLPYKVVSLKTTLRGLILSSALVASVAFGAVYWGTLNTEVVQANQENIVLTFTSGGSAVDISSWTFKYKATATWTDSTCSVPNDSTSQSDSGSGTTDTVTIPLSEYQTGRLPAGKYTQEIVAVISGDTRTLFRGTLRVYEKVAE